MNIAFRNFVWAAAVAPLVVAGANAQQAYQYPAAPQYAPPQYQQQAPYAQQPGDEYQQQPQYAQPGEQYSQPQSPDAANAYDQNQYDQLGGADTQSTPTQAPLSADQLEQLLAPVALYPDSLLAQILAAATYPAQIAAADQWIHQMQAQGNTDPNQIVSGADAQTGWDPSVKALTTFPQVLDMLNKNLDWTTSLGNAYYNQPQDVMQTVQVLRDRAEQAGTLQSTPQEEVSEDQGNIDLEPASPDEAYVPAYNPWVVYGAPIAPYPGFACPNLLGGFGGGYGYGGLEFGAGIAMAAFDRMPWGWGAWGLNWLGHSVRFNRSDFYTHSRTVADWGFPHGGPRAHGWNGGAAYGYRGGGNVGIDRRPMPYNRAGGFENGGRPAFAGQNNRLANGSNGWDRGYPQPGFGMTHPEYPGGEALNRGPFASGARPQAYAGRPQQFAARPQYDARGYYGRQPNAYNYDNRAYDNRTMQAYAQRPGMGYASPYQANRMQEPRAQAYNYRAQQFEAPRSFNSRPGGSYGNGFARNENPGGFRAFGGREPKGPSYGAPKNFFGGHQSRGFSHESAPKMPHGGGGHFGGGHSGGGHHRF